MEAQRKHLGQPLKKGTQKASRKPETVRGKTQMNPSGVVRIRFRSFPKQEAQKLKGNMSEERIF